MELPEQSRDVMSQIVHLVLLTMSLLSTRSHGNTAHRHEGTKEYCQLEKFQATCKNNEVVLMDTAYYGRMKVGRCVKDDMGHIGCSEDVLDIADLKCSGRHSCEIHIPNEQLEKTKPCNAEMKSYFQANYSCVKVAKLDGSLCGSDCESVMLTQPSGYIASVVTQDTGCGTDRCPWKIEAKPGQQINISMFDFTRHRVGDSSLSTTYSTACTQVIDYIFIKDTVSAKTVSICGGTERRKHIYLSVGNTVEVDLLHTKGYFLLHYEILGCPDLELDEDMWFRREPGGRYAWVGCTSSNRKWHVTCMQPNWMGDIGNCSKHKDESKPMAVSGIPLGYGTAIIIIVFVAVAVGILILAIGLLGWRWKKEERSRRRGRHRNTNKAHEPMKSTFEIEPVDNFENCMKHHHSCSMEPYTHVWELPSAQRHDVTILPEEVHRANLMATYGTTECVNKRIPMGHVCSTLDRCSITYTRPDALEPVSEESARYFDLELQ